MDLERRPGLGARRSFIGIGSTITACVLGAFALTAAHPGEALACGGCLVQQSENTQVTSHRMALSISPEATTLWDQISYSGEPESFAWVLPVKGLADVGLSSDAMFTVLDQSTTVQIRSPQINCAPPSCPGRGVNDSAAGAPPPSAEEGGVTVVAQSTVGPYETVQLRSDDPNALSDWLTTNGYNLPPDIAPVVSAYVTEGFDFLALKLVPGKGVSSMRPVRITLPGANPALPLRMVAAGTGAVTPITLWVLGEGRYQPTNFASFLIQADELTWNWDSQASDYREVRAERFAAEGGRAWLVEAAEPFSLFGVQSSLLDLAQYSPESSGYADENGEGAVEAAGADLERLFSTIPEGNLWISRLYGELSREALATDLEVGATPDQAIVERFLQVSRATGTPPACPPPPPGCEAGDSGSSGELTPGSCAMEPRRDGPLALLGALGLSALGLMRRRRGSLRRR
jgi:Uncharacterized protein conserved in bacteria (DUF2330)